LYTSAGSPGDLVVADFNHDGAPDIALQNQFNNSPVTIYLNAGDVANVLTSSLNPSKAGQAVTFKSTVVATLQGVTAIPTGSIVFKDGTATVATVKLKAGRASFTTSTLTKGNHNITASYSGDSTFIPKVSSALVQVVQ